MRPLHHFEGIESTHSLFDEEVFSTSALTFCEQLPASYQRSDRPTLIFDFPSNPKVQRFKFHVFESFLYDTLQEVQSYRPTHGLSSEWDTEGHPAGNLTVVAEYWINRYD
ncbi:uncharacterized protein CLUP02_04570 [Colletotrichum lupini]|uniref:Uncharacterized protein n=1 Tax=Colletotrichum lupini TaxID=145971 RepID=A0A9Q8SLK3_9PEZI|nr:uncharacterized protein CLUP02_04570 [Colletotrichum lupini]UQC79091.1 hypothetical protein CLUP02_04570 [Colletotrichum lupini]